MGRELLQLAKPAEDFLLRWASLTTQHAKFAQQLMEQEHQAQ